MKPHPHQQHSSGTEANFRSNVTEVMSGLMLSASACSYIFNHRSRVFLSSSHKPCSPCWTVRWALPFFSWMWHNFDLTFAQCTPCFPHLNLNPIPLKPARVYEFMLLSAKSIIYTCTLYFIFSSPKKVSAWKRKGLQFWLALADCCRISTTLMATCHFPLRAVYRQPMWATRSRLTNPLFLTKVD